MYLPQFSASILWKALGLRQLSWISLLCTNRVRNQDNHCSPTHSPGDEWGEYPLVSPSTPLIAPNGSPGQSIACGAIPSAAASLRIVAMRGLAPRSISSTVLAARFAFVASSFMLIAACRRAAVNVGLSGTTAPIPIPSRPVQLLRLTSNQWPKHTLLPFKTEPDTETAIQNTMITNNSTSNAM